MSVTLPTSMPGHWDTAEGREMAERYLEQDRNQLGKAELSDLALANAQYLEDISVGTVTFQSAIAMQTAAKERIRWLSAHLAAAKLQNEVARDALIQADLKIRGFAGTDQSDVDFIRQVLACERCGKPPVREYLDGDALCQACCNDWVRGEGAAAAEHEALAEAIARGEHP